MLDDVLLNGLHVHLSQQVALTDIWEQFLVFRNYSDTQILHSGDENRNGAEVSLVSFLAVFNKISLHGLASFV